MTGYAWFAADAYAAAIVEADRAAPKETGGLLLGYRHSPQEVVVSAIVGPGPRARHGIRSFEPDAEWQRAEVALRYEAAGRRLHYLGDWHTHPGGIPTLSRLDRSTLHQTARYGPARCPLPVMAVFGGGDPWRLALYQLAPGWWRRRLTLLTVRLTVPPHHDG